MPTSSTATDNTISNTASGAPAALTDQLIMERGTTGYKLLVSDIAKAVVELYSGSSLAGASQSVKAALDSLNSRMAVPMIKQFRFQDITDASTDTLSDLGVIPSNANYGNVFMVLRTDRQADGASCYIVRHNSAGWQISTIYQGTAPTTPIIDSNGVVKLLSNTPSTVHTFAVAFQLWN